jgi:hypothetical protein
VSEQLGFDQLAWQSRAIDLDERAFLPLTVLVDGARNELLAGAVLAVNQHAGVGRRHGFDEVKELPHLVAARDDVGEARVIAELLFQPFVLGGQLQFFGRLVQHHEQDVCIDRFLDEAESAGLHRFDGFGDAAIPGHHNDLGFRTRFLEVSEQVNPVGVRQHQVHQHHFWPPGAKNLAGLCGVRRGPGQIPSWLYQQLQEISGIPVIVDDKYAGRHLFTLPTLGVLFNYTL